MRECLAFFLAQDYPAKRLFILNNHPVPLRCELPEVTIFNEPSDEPGIPRNRLLAKVGSDFEFVHTWDDDDAWLPWHLSQAVRQMDGLVSARKGPPRGSRPIVDPLHADWRVQAEREQLRSLDDRQHDYMAEVGYGIASGNEHRPLLDALKADKALATTEVGARASYIYTWRGDFIARERGAGARHEGRRPRETLAERDAAWRKLQTDPGDGKTPLTPADIRPRYRDLLAHCRSGLSEYEALELQQLLGRYCGEFAA